MNSINPNNFFSEYIPGKGGYSGGSQRGSIQTAQDIKSDITITTKEGDKVTLKSVVGRHITFNTYEDWTKESARNLLHFSIKGDLNEEELQDINKVLDSVDQSLRNQIDGDFGKLEAASVNIDNAGTLETFSGSFQQIDIPDRALTEEELQRSFQIQNDLMMMYHDRPLDRHHQTPSGVLDASVEKPSYQLEELQKSDNGLLVELLIKTGREGETGTSTEGQITDYREKLIKIMFVSLWEKLDFYNAAEQNIVNETV